MNLETLDGFVTHIKRAIYAELTSNTCYPNTEEGIEQFKDKIMKECEKLEPQVWLLESFDISKEDGKMHVIFRHHAYRPTTLTMKIGGSDV